MDYNTTALLLAIFTGGLFGSGSFIIYQLLSNKQRKKKLDRELNRIINKAQSEATRIKKTAEVQAKDTEIKTQKKIEKEYLDKKRETQVESEKLQLLQTKKENEYERKLEVLEEQQKEVVQQKKNLEERQTQLKILEEEQKEELKKLHNQLESIAQISQKQAEEELKELIKEEVRLNLAPQVQKMEEDMKKESEMKAKNILARSIARQASVVTTEQTITSIPVEEDDVKGKIIGREGRNIRALEQACGVDVLIEEGQDAIILSCFDPVRRFIAETAIHQLIKDGRIHPVRIEEVVDKVKVEIFNQMKEDGEQACFDLNIHDVHPEILQTLGGLKFKTLKGQNALKTSMDLALLAGHIMSELNEDEVSARRAALFHCIGLNVDHKIKGNYAQVGANFIKKYREKPHIVQAVRSHSSNVPAETLLDHILQASFNLYQSLPSTKKFNVEGFINRMKRVESIANSFSGVIRSYAIRSGKELRVIVDSSRVTDDQTIMLCSDIVKKLERELDMSYSLKVSVIRESRIIEHAR